MTLNNNIKNRLSQANLSTLQAFGIGITIFLSFFAILFVDTDILAKIVLVLFIAFSPFFIIKPKSLLFFVFLVTPSIRVLTKNGIIYQNENFILNFNALINVAILIFGGLFLIKNKNKFKKLLIKNRTFFIFLLFILVVGLSILSSVNKGNSIEEFLRIITIFILFIFTYLNTKTKKDFNQLLVIIVLGAVPPLLIAFNQLLQTDAGWWDKTIMRFRINGTFLHPATLAFYLLATIPILYSILKDKTNTAYQASARLLIPFMLFIIVATLARGAWIGLLIMFFLYGILKNRKFLLGGIAVLFISYLAVSPITNRINDIFHPKYNSSLKTRIKIVETTLPAFSQKPLMGYGIGEFEEIHLKYNSEAYSYSSKQAHNDYVRLLIEIGLIGLSLYISIFITIFIFILKEIKTTKEENYKNHLISLAILWLGMLTISLGDNILRTMPVQFVLWSYTGAIFAFKNIKDTTNNI